MKKSYSRFKFNGNLASYNVELALKQTIKSHEKILLLDPGMKQMYLYSFESVNSETGEIIQSLDEIELDGLPDQNHLGYS